MRGTLAVADALLACMAGAVAEVIHGFPRDIADRSDAYVNDDLRADSGTVRGGAAGVSYSWLGVAVQSNLL